MRRRLFLSLIGAARIASASDAAKQQSQSNPLIRLRDAGNAFGSQFNRWIEAWNKGPGKTGALDLNEAREFETLPKLYREMESARKDWLRGLR